MKNNFNETYFISLDFGGTNLKGAIVSSKGICIADVVKTSSFVNDSFDEFKVSLKFLMAKLISQIDFFNNIPIEAILVSIPGPFDYQKGISLMEDRFNVIKGIDLRKLIRECYFEDCDIIFLHDCIAFCYGSYYSNKLTYKCVAALRLGTSVGFVVGDDGYIDVDELGSPKLNLYKEKYMDGIIDDYFSSRGMKRIYYEMTNKEVITSRDIYYKAAAGDTEAREALNKFGTLLGKALKKYIIEAKAEALIIGGAVSKAFPYFKDNLQEELQGIALIYLTSSNNILSGNIFHYLSLKK